MGCRIHKISLLVALAIQVMRYSAAATATGEPAAYYPFQGSNRKIGMKVISRPQHIGILSGKYLQRDLASVMGQEYRWASASKRVRLYRQRTPIPNTFKSTSVPSPPPPRPESQIPIPFPFISVPPRAPPHM